MRGADSLRPQSIDDGRKLDEIPTEAFKADTETSINILNGHFWEIWERRRIQKIGKKAFLLSC